MPALNFASKVGAASVAGAAGGGSAFTASGGIGSVDGLACWVRGPWLANDPVAKINVATNASTIAAGRATLGKKNCLFGFLIDPSRDRFCQTAHANARIRDGRPYYPTLAIEVPCGRAGRKRRRQPVIAAVTVAAARTELSAPSPSGSRRHCGSSAV